MSRQTAILLVLLSALGFGSIALFARLAYAEGMSPTMLLTLRFLIASLLLAPVVLARRLRLPRGKALAGFALMGALYTAQAQSYFTALLHASSGLVGMLLYAYPVLVTLLSLFLGWQRLDRRTLGLMAMAVCGIAITLGGNLQGSPLGIALGLLAAVVYAVYILLGDRLTQHTDPLAATFVIMSAAALGNGALAIIGGHPLPVSLTAWSAVAAIALFSTVIAIAAFLVGIKVIGASHASIISTLEPVITLCLGMLLLGEKASGNQLAGSALVLAAVILLARKPQAPQTAACQPG